ncbi:hypothetical protein CesoFtcFv8_020564 [Champsocephalus esox]|uniref:Uncharacterized protein n=1 Tax=Champsocephalus esox TaxID=159716 RepID=A0AAN8BBP8_9TELE|nr:hypothetical protein CesoFtcFv8_020564 [Champsocephalus esox]
MHLLTDTASGNTVTPPSHTNTLPNSSTQDFSHSCSNVCSSNVCNSKTLSKKSPRARVMLHSSEFNADYCDST